MEALTLCELDPQQGLVPIPKIFLMGNLERNA